MSTTPAPDRLTVSERRLELGGIETRALEIDGEGPPWLLLHGFADSADTWRPVLAELASKGRRAMAIDLRGFGTAAPLAASGPLLPQWDPMIDDAVGELVAAGPEDEVLIAGNSLGGCLSIRAAEREDLPLGGIVPIAPAGLDMARWFPVIESERLLRLLRYSPVPVPQVVVREVVSRVYKSLAFADQKLAEADVIDSFTQHFPSVDRATEILDTGRRMLPELAKPYRLERIDCPLLLVWGEKDRLVYTTGAERVLRIVPYSDIEIIENCGHCPQVEVPARLGEILAGFPEAMSQD